MVEDTDASDVSLSGETAKATIAKFTMAAVGFVSTIVFARLLGPEKFGAFYLLFALAKVVELPIEGWAMAAKKRFSEAGARTPEIVGGSLLVVGAWVAVGAGGALLAGEWLASYTSVAAAASLFIALLGGEAVYVASERLLQARGLVGKATWTDALRSYLTFPLQLALVLSGWGVAGMAYGLAAASLLVTPLTLYFVGVRPSMPSRATVASQWEYARYSMLSALFGRVYERIDVLLLGYLIGPTAAGWYEVAFKLVTPAKFVAEAASSGLMARVSHLSSRSEALGEDVTNVLSFASVLSVPIFFGGLVVAEPLIVTIYGAAYAAAAPLLIVIALYHVFITLNSPLVQTVYGIDKPRVMMVLSGIVAGSNAILGFLLVPVIGAVGAAIATLATEVLEFVVLVWLINQYVEGVDVVPSALQKQVIAGVVMLGLVFGVSRLGLGTGIVYLAVALGLGGVSYFGVLLGTSAELRVTLRSAVRKLV